MFLKALSETPKLNQLKAPRLLNRLRIPTLQRLPSHVDILRLSDWLWFKLHTRSLASIVRSWGLAPFSFEVNKA